MKGKINMEQFTTIVLTLIGLTLFAWWLRGIGKASIGVFLGATLANVAIVLGISLLMFFLQSNGQYTYNQFYSGTETRVELVRHMCAIDGGCEHTYTRSETEFCTKSGTPTTCTKYYYDDLFVEEDDWIIHTTIGSFTVGDHVLPNNWQPGEAYTRYRDLDLYQLHQDALDAGIGEPRRAVASQLAIAAGHPLPATKIVPYSNPINGSGGKTATSDKVDYYKKLGVLPAINSTVYNDDQSNKVLFAGIAPPRAC